MKTHGTATENAKWTPIVTHTIKLRTSSNTALDNEQVREILLQHLRERFKITDIDESKISIE